MLFTTTRASATASFQRLLLSWRCGLHSLCLVFDRRAGWCRKSILHIWCKAGFPHSSRVRVKCCCPFRNLFSGSGGLFCWTCDLRPIRNWGTWSCWTKMKIDFSFGYFCWKQISLLSRNTLWVLKTIMPSKELSSSTRSSLFFLSSSSFIEFQIVEFKHVSCSTFVWVFQILAPVIRVFLGFSCSNLA